MLRFQTAWKVYFYLLLLGSVLGIGSDIREQIENPSLLGTFVSVVGYIVTAIGLVGLYGFAWRQRIWKVKFWRIFLTLNIFLLVAAVVFGLKTEPEAEKVPLGDLLFLLGIIVFLAAPYFVANFIYAFRNEYLWKTASYPAAQPGARK